jgi:hypothetical protein
VRDVCLRGGLTDFSSVLSEPLVYVPQDSVVPGLLTIADLPDLAAAVPTCRLEGMVDGVNRAMADKAVREAYNAPAGSRAKGDRMGLIVGNTHGSAIRWIKVSFTPAPAPD